LPGVVSTVLGGHSLGADRADTGVGASLRIQAGQAYLVEPVDDLPEDGMPSSPWTNRAIAGTVVRPAEARSLSRAVAGSAIPSPIARSVAAGDVLGGLDTRCRRRSFRSAAGILSR
jgi:hypothetical protein